MQTTFAPAGPAPDATQRYDGRIAWLGHLPDLATLVLGPVLTEIPSSAGVGAAAPLAGALTLGRPSTSLMALPLRPGAHDRRLARRAAWAGAINMSHETIAARAGDLISDAADCGSSCLCAHSIPARSEQLPPGSRIGSAAGAARGRI